MRTLIYFPWGMSRKQQKTKKQQQYFQANTFMKRHALGVESLSH